LVMGADDDKVESAKDPLVLKDFFEKYNIKNSDFLIVTGGKIDYAKKQTLLLMEAIQNIPNEKVKLIVFGSIIPSLKEEFDAFVDGKKIQYAGWRKAEESYEYCAAAGLVVFRGRHSVFWEQVVGQGIPMVVRWREVTSHIDNGRNVKLLYDDSVEEIIKVLSEIIGNDQMYQSMNKASKRDNEQFLYSDIAKKSINLS